MEEKKKPRSNQYSYLGSVTAWWCLHQWLQCKDDLLREPSAEELWHDTGSAEPERFRLQPTDTLPTTPGTKETSASDNDHLCTLKSRSVWFRESVTHVLLNGVGMIETQNPFTDDHNPQLHATSLQETRDIERITNKSMPRTLASCWNVQQTFFSNVTRMFEQLFGL